MNAVTVSLKFIPTIALLNRLCVLTSPKYIICIIKYLWVLFLTMMGKICVFICKEWQQRVWVTYFVFVVLWRDFEFFFWFFSTRSKMMGRTFKCMFFIQRDWLFLSRVKRECKDQSPSLLFRKNLAFRRFFTVIHILHWLHWLQMSSVVSFFWVCGLLQIFTRTHKNIFPHYFQI